MVHAQLGENGSRFGAGRHLVIMRPNVSNYLMTDSLRSTAAGHVNPIPDA
ncbi:MAG: hypothetical protein RJA94_2742 [Pseudomonadota bacterium]|jgi:hypothetical protein